MLGKLIKHEFKAFSRSMIPLLIVFLSFSAMFFVWIMKWNGLVHEEDSYVISSLLIFILPVYMYTFIAIFFLSYVKCVLRFRQTMFSNEGYLMRTIPVKTSSHLIAKLLVAFIWFIISYVCFFVVMQLMTLSPERSFISSFTYSFRNYFGDNAKEIALNFLSFLQHFLYIQLLLIAGVTIGNSASEHKTAASIAAVIILNMLVAFVAGIVIAFLRVSLDTDSMTPTLLGTYSEELSMAERAKDIVQIVFTILFFIFTCRTIDKNCDIE